MPGAPMLGLANRDDSSGDVGAVLPDGIGPPASVPPQMFTAAVDTYASCRRLDMQSLARHLGVGRATLYRRAGNREELLDEVIWWRSRRVLTGHLLAARDLSGAARIAAVVGGVLRAIERDRAAALLNRGRPRHCAADPYRGPQRHRDRHDRSPGAAYRS